MNRRSLLQSIESLPLVSGLSEHDGSDRSSNEVDVGKRVLANEKSVLKVYVKEEW